ncbi:hypothetical protein BDR06DRAFT_999779 [Suillus hirtellus]|nr:hypothetical protein BDR06DRAFT_999779 [Suillus hirtellus]
MTKAQRRATTKAQGSWGTAGTKEVDDKGTKEVDDKGTKEVEKAQGRWETAGTKEVDDNDDKGRTMGAQWRQGMAGTMSTVMRRARKHEKGPLVQIRKHSRRCRACRIKIGI